MECFNTKQGEYVLLYGQDGWLHDDAMEAFHHAAETGADFIFADEACQIDENTVQPIHKPVYSPDTMLSYNAVGFPLAVKRTLYESALPVDVENAASYYAFVLRAAHRATFIYHIPLTLYTGKRMALPKEYAFLDAAICAMGRHGLAAQGRTTDTFSVRYGIRTPSKISVIVRGNEAAAIRKTLESIELFDTYRDLEFLVAYVGTPTIAEKTYFAALEQNAKVRIFLSQSQTDDTPVSAAALQATGDTLLFIDAGITLWCYDGLERMLEIAQQNGVGVVGAKLLTHEKQIVQAGLALGIAPLPVSLFMGQKESLTDPLQNKYCNCIRNVSAVSRVLMIEREFFLDTGGFDHTVPNCVTDAAFCVAAGRRRYHVYTPYARFLAPVLPKPQLTADEERRVTDIFRKFRYHGDPMLTQAPAVIATYLAKKEE